MGRLHFSPLQDLLMELLQCLTYKNKKYFNGAILYIFKAKLPIPVWMGRSCDGRTYNKLKVNTLKKTRISRLQLVIYLYLRSYLSKRSHKLLSGRKKKKKTTEVLLQVSFAVNEWEVRKPEHCSLLSAKKNISCLKNP